MSTDNRYYGDGSVAGCVAVINVNKEYESLCFFFFFKQKTAYEIYQCDWSSDVCSSDLQIRALRSGA